MNGAMKLCLLAGVLTSLTSCGGSKQQAAATASLISDGTGEKISATGPESGPPTKIIGVPGNAGAVVALFPDGRAFYSPDGFNLGGGGSTVSANGGNSFKVIDIRAVNAGVDALLSDGSAYFSPDGMNLGGGGSTVHAYSGTSKIASLSSVGSGIDVVFANGGGAFYSPDGLNLGGGGTSVSIYSGQGEILQIVPVGTGDAVVTLFHGGSAFFSPNNRDIGGGGSTVAAAPSAHSSITGLVEVGGGVLTVFANGEVYLSPDGQNLAGGGATVLVPAWDTSLANGPFAPRDSAAGTQFAGHLWLSGGYNNPTYTDSCFATCSFFDLWSSTDSTGTSWNSTPSFATATSPNPRDASAVTNNGVQDVPVPTDFYDAYSPIVVWNSRLWAIGRTVWSSSDGVTWDRQNLADGVTAAPGPAPLRAGENSRAVVLGASLFFLQPDAGAVFSTTDPNAVSWTSLGTIPGFTPRCGAAVFVLLGKIWIEGGGACDYSQTFNDIWSSADGVTWTHSALDARWSARMWPCVASGSDGIMWLAGGYAPTDWNDASGTVTVRYGANHSDVWYSKDGVNWRQLKADNGSALPDGTALEPRHAPTCYVAAGSSAGTNSLVVIGGTSSPNPDGASAAVVNSIRALPLPATAALP
jgi:hypothetical protein